jgi:hypothetical protein
MSKVTKAVSKQNSVQSIQNLEREVKRWTEVLKALAIKRNDATASRLWGQFEGVLSSVDVIQREYITDEARRIHADKLEASRIKAMLKAGKAVLETEEDNTEIDL